MAWRRSTDPADIALKELAALRQEVEALRKRIHAAQHHERRLATRRRIPRSDAADRRATKI
jgi:hypothetical protein